MTRIGIRLGVTAATVSMVLASGQPFASSHTDAPFITLDLAANTTDVYAFRSERGGQAYLTTAAAVYPFEEQNLDHQAQLNQLAPQEAAPPSLPRAQEPGADAHRALGDEAVVYHWRKTVSPDGRAVERTPVSELVDWLDAGGEIDLEHLVDSRGRHYRLVADAWQEAEEEDVHYEVKLVRYAKQYQSAEEIEKSWRQTYPFATRAEFDAFQAERRSRPTLPEPAQVMTDDLLDWLAQAAVGEAIDVVVMLQETASPLDLPRAASNLFNDEPALALQQLQDRLLAIEMRKNELEELQAPVIANMRAKGGKLRDTYWLINGFEARVSADTLLALGADASVRRIERFEPGVPDTNNLNDMREAAQVTELHDDGHDGETASGRSSVNDIYLAILDTDIDADHPAWDDWSGGPSRLVDVWRKTGGVWGTVTTSATATPSHGTKVAGIALADLMQGQDPAIALTGDRDDRTGFAPEASFSFIEVDGATSSIEKAVDLGVDIANLSMSFGTSTLCNLSASSNDAVDEALLDGVFLTKSGGNNGFSGANCVVGNPGTASGAFTVNQIDRTAVPLQAGSLNGGASRGGDSIGRSVISMAAYAGPEGATAAGVDDTYGAFGASSSAAPVVAGSAAAMKDHLLGVFSSSLINEAGMMHALMLLMGDGELEGGGSATALDPLDDVWGAGRLRVRMFNAVGMDAPWRCRLFTRTIDDGEHATDMPVNPDSFGVNQALSADVERLRATAYWHEPNIEDGSAFTAEISFHIQNDLGNTYAGFNPADHRQRIVMGNVIGGREWTLHLNGLDVPQSLDSNYFHLQDKRKVYVAVYWEDTDRDDADGPSVEIQ